MIKTDDDDDDDPLIVYINLFPLKPGSYVRTRKSMPREWILFYIKDDDCEDK